MKKSVIVIIIVLIVIALGGIAWMAMREASPETSEETTQDESLTPETDTGENDEEEQSTEYGVVYTGNGFEPTSLTINQGDTVIFRNASNTGMWLASDSHPSHTDYPEFDAGRGYSVEESYSFTFDRAGEWGFHNHLNPVHTGTVIVQ